MSVLPTLHGIGVGPGDPELLTIKGARLIREAGVIFVPAARSGQRSLARSIAAPYIDGDKRVVELIYPTDGRARQMLEDCWDASADTIAIALQREPMGVFLTEGDAMLYSTFIYTMEALSRRHPAVNIEIVPGVSSIHAAAAATGVPLATADQRVAILPSDSPEAVLRSTLTTSDTTVLLKLSSGAETLLNLLDELRLMDHAVWIRRCGQPEQEIVRDVRALRNQRLDYFSLMIVKRPGQ